jgi:aminoglycoside phosphotransferase (APT) family kinase protein
MVRTPADELPFALEAVVRKRIPGAARGRVVNWRRSSAGFSTETFLFDVAGLEDGGTLGLVLRRPPEFPILPDYDLRRQYLVMQRLARSGVPVPSVRWLDTTGGAVGTPYFVMDRVDDVVGVSDVPPYHSTGIFADADDGGRATLWNGCVDMIAAVHRVDPHAHRLGFLGPATPEALTAFLRSALRWAYGGAPLHPAFVRALDWLAAHRYEPERVGLCWGDARMSNVLYRRDFTPRVVLDWEIAYLGDQAADISWLLLTDWVSSPLPDHAPAPGTPSREETVERYERAVGHRIGNLAFTDVTATLLLAVALVRLNERIPGVDLADICAQRIDLVLNS